MIIYKKIKEITTPEEFKNIMESVKNVKIVIEDDEGRFCMMYIPQSSLFENCYSVVSTWNIEKNNNDKFVYVKSASLKNLSPEKLKEYHFEKKSVNFALMFSKLIKEMLQAKAFLIEGWGAVESK
jgi:hypothetical protein